MSAPASKASDVLNLLFIVLHCCWMIPAGILLFIVVGFGILLSDLGAALSHFGKSGVRCIDKICKD